MYICVWSLCMYTCKIAEEISIWTKVLDNIKNWLFF